MKTAQSNPKSGTAELVAKAADEFLKAAEAGNSPKIEEFIERYPQIAAILRDVLPALAIINPSLSGNREQPLGTDDLIDRSLGDFRLIREIGRGGMGVVYEAEQISLGRSVALKVLPFAGVLDEKQLQRFKNEARAAAALEHPHIVPVYSVGCERGVHYYAMRLIDGQSLTEILQAIPADGADRTGGRPEAEVRSPNAGDRKSEAGVRKSDIDVLHAVRANGVGCSPHDTPSPFTREGRSEGEESPKVSALAPTADLRSSNSAADTRPNLQSIITTDAGFDSLVYFRNVARLGSQVAEALGYAHEQGVLHRDIKPGNLLLDVHGNLWIADFGLARLEQDAGITVTGDLLGTLRYMSPEQALGQRVLDERSDVYSLGVTLYEMLVLRPAFSGHNRQEILHHIASDEPKPPRQINPRIPRDLETIILRAIAKEPTSRYQTAQQFADDLKRFLSNQPIQARRPKFLEKCVKWSRRHPAAVWATILVLLATTVVSGISTALIIKAFNGEATARHQAEENEGTANANAQRATAITKFMVNAFRSPDPYVDGRTITVAEVLDRAAKNLPKEFSNDPATRAALLHAIGESYVGLGLYHEAVPLLKQAFDFSETALGSQDEKTVNDMQDLAGAYLQDERVSDALPMFEKVLEFRKARYGPDDSKTLVSMSDLAEAYSDAGRNAEAIKLLEEAIRKSKFLDSADYEETLDRMQNLASAYYTADRVDEAISLLKKTLDLRKARQGADSPHTIGAMHNLAIFYSTSGRLKEDIPLLEETLKLEKSVLGTSHLDTLSTANLLGKAYVITGRPAEAVPLFEEALTIRKAKRGLEHRDTLASMNDLAEAYLNVGRAADAEAVARECLAIRERTLPDDWETFHVRVLLGVALLQQHKPSAAEPLLLSGYEGMNARAATIPDECKPYLQDAIQHVVELYEATDQPKKTADWRAKMTVQRAQLTKVISNPDKVVASTSAGRLDSAIAANQEIVERLKSQQDPDNPDTLGAMANLASAYQQAGRYDEAAKLFGETLKLIKAKLGPDDPLTLAAMKTLADAYKKAGRPDEALTLREQIYRLWKAKAPEDPNSFNSMYDLSEAYQLAGRLDDALPHNEEGFRYRTAKLGPAAPGTQWSFVRLVGLLLEQGKLSEAESRLREYLPTVRAKLAADSPDLAGVVVLLAVTLIREEKFVEAEPLAREALTIREKKHPDNWRTFNSRSLLGAALLGQHKYAEAEPLLLSGYEGMNRHAQAIPELYKSYLKDSLQRLVDLYEATDQPKKAAEWKARMTPQEKK